MTKSKKYISLMLYLCAIIVSYTASRSIIHHINNGLMSDKPLLTLQDYNLNLGRVIEGILIKKSFVILNNSDKTISINARTSCGCTKATISRKNIDPGNTTIITIWLDTSNRSGFVEQYVNITTNDPQNKSFRLTLSAEVVPEIEITPDHLWLREVSRNTDIAREITFSKRNDEKFDIKRVIVPEGVAYIIGDKTINDEVTEIPVRFIINTGDTLGYYNRTIVVETTRSKIKEHEIEISGQVLPDLKVIPPQVYIRDVEQGETITKNIRITPMKESIRSISAINGNENVTVGDCTREQEQFVLPLTIQVPEHQASLQDTIRVYYNDLTETDILIPLRLETITKVSMNN